MSNARNIARLLANANGELLSTSIASIPGSKINSAVDSSAMPIGSVLQVKFNNANYNWGSVGNSNEWDLTWLDISLTTKGANSAFFIASQFSTDDTNSAAYGVGIGAKYSINGGSTWTSIRTAAQHEDYNSVGSDKYKVPRHATTFALTLPINTPVIFRVTGRFNNSNGQYFNGNGQQFSQMHTVMEIKNG